jgi:hypothetical protein
MHKRHTVIDAEEHHRQARRITATVRQKNGRVSFVVPMPAATPRDEDMAPGTW